VSFANPTPLRLGATGALNGWRVRVAGRVVMGVEDHGERYYWNEFNLVDDAGNSATLVFEETEEGPEWKLFRDFTPSQPLTAAEAASKKVGDKVSLDGTPARVTLVGESRVHHIEGSAPEGVEVGDVAHYFNVDTGSRMLVASWTGAEIEFYEGLDAAAESVAAAFGFPAARPVARPAGLSSAFSAGEGPRSRTSPLKLGGLAVLGAITLLVAYACFSRSNRTSGRARPTSTLRQPAPPLRLAAGAEGTLGQQRYSIGAHSLVEIARVTGRHERREYQLPASDGTSALLINALSGGTKEWHLFRPLAFPPALDPYAAAALRKSASVVVDGRTLRVTDLFLATTHSEDAAGTRSASAPETVRYGFVAQDGAEWLVARWTETEIQFLRGTQVSDTEVLAAFTPSGKAK
jgi:hypothetical protein